MKKYSLYIVTLLCMALVSCTEDKFPSGMAFGTPSSVVVEADAITASQSSLSFTADGGSQSITVTSNFTWRIISSPSWITISPTSGTSGSTSITINASKNSNTSVQSGTITLGNSSKTVSISVSQSAANVNYEISASSTSLSFTADGGSQTITITSNFSPWETISKPSWITLSPSRGTNGSTSVTVTASKNTNASENTGTLILGNSSITSTSISIKQNAATSYSVSGNTYTINGVSFNMIRVDGGTFNMGPGDDNTGDEDYYDSTPTHSVTLSSYSIGQTEVTQELWEAVMGNNPSSIKGTKHPVESVSWNECQDFINAINLLTGWNFCLPTEAEWEFAARGGNKSNGYRYAGSNYIDDVGWIGDNSGAQTHDVAKKKANELGIYDMCGNVYEWCQDWYEKYSSERQINPTGPSSSNLNCRIIRGGSWKYMDCCRVWSRMWWIPSQHYDLVGFRLAQR